MEVVSGTFSRMSSSDFETLLNLTGSKISKGGSKGV